MNGEHIEALDCVINGHIENEAEHGVVVYTEILLKIVCVCVGEWIAGDFVEAFHYFISSLLHIGSFTSNEQNEISVKEFLWS